MLTPVALFAYNRPEHLRQTVSFLLRNKEASETELYVFSDASKSQSDDKKVAEVRKLIHDISGFRHVHIFENQVNLGLKVSVRTGIDKVLSKHDRLIALEDDVCVNSNFLNYHNTCLQKYQSNHRVWSVSGYVIPKLGSLIHSKTSESYFLAPRASSWGWSTWKDRWEKMIWDDKEIMNHLFTDGHLKAYNLTGGDKLRMLFNNIEHKINSWAIIWDYCHFMQGGYCLYPAKSFASNIGLDNSGTHTKALPEYEVALSDWTFDPRQLPEKPELNRKVNAIFRKINRKFYHDVRDYFRAAKIKQQFKIE